MKSHGSHTNVSKMAEYRTICTESTVFESLSVRHNCTEILIQISVQLFYAKRLYSTMFRE